MRDATAKPKDHGLRIVIAEDDPTTRKLATKWLTDAGHKVWPTCDGQEAQSVMAKVQPELLITDWEMPYGSDNIREVKLFPIGVGPGNYGTVDIGNSNNSTADLSRQIVHGPNQADLAYFPNSTLELGLDGTLVLEGDTGISAGIKDELTAIKGQPRIIPLYGTVSGNGNNARFTIVGFAGVTILDVQLTGPLRDRSITIQPAFVIDRSAVDSGEDGLTSRFIRSPVSLRGI